MAPMGKRLFAGYNPVHTAGPMQVSIAYAEKHAAAKPYPYPMDGSSIRREVFNRILLERARALPVDVRERHRVTGLIVEGGLVRGVKAESAEGRPSFQARSSRSANIP